MSQDRSGRSEGGEAALVEECTEGMVCLGALSLEVSGHFGFLFDSYVAPFSPQMRSFAGCLLSELYQVCVVLVYIAL